MLRRWVLIIVYWIHNSMIHANGRKINMNCYCIYLLAALYFVLVQLNYATVDVWINNNVMQVCASFVQIKIFKYSLFGSAREMRFCAWHHLIWKELWNVPNSMELGEKDRSELIEYFNFRYFSDNWKHIQHMHCCDLDPFSKRHTHWYTYRRKWSGQLKWKWAICMVNQHKSVYWSVSTKIYANQCIVSAMRTKQ